MGEPSPPRNRDQDIPPRTGDETGAPVVPQPRPEPHERRPVPEEETYERDREKPQADEERPPVEDP
jgi:hypothetical protein